MENKPQSTDETGKETAVETAAPVTYSQDEVDILVGLAEQQGYLRCRNEMAARELEKPALGDTPALPAPETEPLKTETLILNRSRRSIWNL